MSIAVGAGHARDFLLWNQSETDTGFTLFAGMARSHSVARSYIHLSGGAQNVYRCMGDDTPGCRHAAEAHENHTGQRPG